MWRVSILAWFDTKEKQGIPGLFLSRSDSHGKVRARADCSQFDSGNSLWQFIYRHNWIEWFRAKIRTNIARGSQFLRQLLLSPSKILLKNQKGWKFSKKMEHQDWHSTNCKNSEANSTHHKADGEESIQSEASSDFAACPEEKTSWSGTPPPLPVRYLQNLTFQPGNPLSLSCMGATFCGDLNTVCARIALETSFQAIC